MTKSPLTRVANLVLVLVVTFAVLAVLAEVGTSALSRKSTLMMIIGFFFLGILGPGILLTSIWAIKKTVFDDGGEKT